MQEYIYLVKVCAQPSSHNINAVSVGVPNEPTTTRQVRIYLTTSANYIYMNVFGIKYTICEWLAINGEIGYIPQRLGTTDLFQTQERGSSFKSVNDIMEN